MESSQTSLDWPAWMAPVALVGAFLMAAVGALVVDLPAVALGVNVTSKHLPHGLELADTVVQDVAFVVTAVLCASIGGRSVHAWQFGLRPSRVRWARAVGAIAVTYVGLLIFSAIWTALLHVSTKEKLLEQLGANESTVLLVLTAALVTVMAPICEEFLFRGFAFRALSNWKGPWLAAVLTGLAFGLFHAASAPIVYLVPLAVLGFGLCLLYRHTGSLYPCIATHSLNNSIAYGALEGWGFTETVLLIFAALAVLATLVMALRAAGVVSGATPQEIFVSL